MVQKRETDHLKTTLGYLCQCCLPHSYSGVLLGFLQNEWLVENDEAVLSNSFEIVVCSPINCKSSTLRSLCKFGR